MASRSASVSASSNGRSPPTSRQSSPSRCSCRPPRVIRPWNGNAGASTQVSKPTRHASSSSATWPRIRLSIFLNAISPPANTPVRRRMAMAASVASKSRVPLSMATVPAGIGPDQTTGIGPVNGTNRAALSSAPVRSSASKRRMGGIERFRYRHAAGHGQEEIPASPSKPNQARRSPSRKQPPDQ